MQKYLSFEHKAAYHTLNEKTSTTKRVWIVFHGYGQLAEYFIKKFKVLNPKTNFIIAPQGLSKFYREGFTGRVGASWMTKEDRRTDIKNQQYYLRTVMENESITEHTCFELILFGFSQGAATMSRFAAYNNLPFSKLIIWAGNFAHELTQEDVQCWKHSYTIDLFMGKQDPLFDFANTNEQLQKIKKLTGKPCNVTWFDGKHEIVPTLLKDI